MSEEAEAPAQAADGAEVGEESPVVALLQKCPDSQLMGMLPSVLRLLPADAQERCLMAVREALTDEIEGGVLAGDEKGEAALSRMLAAAPPPIGGSAAAGAPPKRSRAMALPFRAVPTAATPAAPEADGGAEDKQAAGSVYVANVPYTATEGELKAFLEESIEPGCVVSVRLLLGPNGHPKGAAVVGLVSGDAVRKATALDGQVGLQDRKLIVKVDQFQPSKGKGKGKGKKGAEGEAVDGQAAKDPEKLRRSVIVKNLAFSATEASIGELFAGCGELTSVRVAKDNRTGRPKGFAVVEFSKESEAKAAIRRDGKKVKDRAVRVESLQPGFGAVARDEGEGEPDATDAADAADPEPKAAPKDSITGKKRPFASMGLSFVKAGDLKVGEGQEAEEDLPKAAAFGSQEAADALEARAAFGKRRAGIGMPASKAASQAAQAAAAAGGEPAAAAAPSAGGGEVSMAEAMRRHAQSLVQGSAPGQADADAAAAAESAKKKSKRGGDAATADAAAAKFPGGEEGLKAASELVAGHASAQALLAAVGADEIKDRLAALGLKAGGAPLDRAERLRSLQGKASLADVPAALFAKGRAPAQPAGEEPEPMVAD